MRIRFNDDHTKIGIEGWYEFIDDCLTIYIEPTNRAEDWITDFIAFPVPLDFYNWKDGWCHVGYKEYAKWAKGYFSAKIEDYGVAKVTKLNVCGYSMGGGVAQMVARYFEIDDPELEIKVINIDGPRTLSKCPEYVRTLYNKGSIIHAIPPWFQFSKDSECLNSVWRPVWISHADYNVDEIINNELK